MYAVPTAGPQRGFVRQFVSSVLGAEMASLAFNTVARRCSSPSSIQERGGTLEAPVSRWPDDGQPPHPSVVVTWSEAGKPIGEA